MHIHAWGPWEQSTEKWESYLNPFFSSDNLKRTFIRQVQSRQCTACGFLEKKYIT